MRSETINIFKFSELSEDAKQKAINSLWDINTDSSWWDAVYDDANNVKLKLTGFDIGRGMYCNGKFIESGLTTAQMIMQEHGGDCETYKTAKHFLSEYDALVKKYSSEDAPDKVSEDNIYDFDNEADELEEEFLQSILEDYRIILTKEYDYLTSEESIIDTIEANEYEFTEDGERY